MTNRYLGITAVSALLTLTAITAGRGDDTATLLPNAIQYFMDANGKPLANGKVFMYTPNTTTPKTTWTTASKSVAQPVPFIPLGIAGKPANPIYGDGSYRQLVKDQFNNTIWDFNTASTGGGSTPVVPTVGDGLAVGTVLPYNGFVVPANYAFAYGQTLSRTTYVDLLNAITSTQSIVCTSGTNIVSNFSDTSQLGPTMPVESPCLPPGTSITAVSNPTTVTVSNNATISGVFTLQVFPAGLGDGSTTFNVPDLRGRAVAGRDNMGGTTAGRITSTFFNGIPGTGLSQSGGVQSNALNSVTNLPPYTPAGTIVVTNGAITTTSNTGGTVAGTAITTPGGGTLASATQTITSTQATTTATFAGITVGTSAPFSVMQPTQLTNFIIKIFPDSLSSDATWQVPLNTVPVGRGTGTGFDFVTTNASLVPKYLQQSGNGTTATAPIWGIVQEFRTTTSVAGLRALAAGINTTIYLLGYYSVNDGGQGIVYWDSASSAADDGCTIFRPDSAPATGRWVRQVSGTDYNVKWCGAKGDGVANDHDAIATAITLAIAVKGGVYVPAAANYYLSNTALVIPDSTHGLRIHGDAHGALVAGSKGSFIVTPAASAIDMTGVASGGTGSISDIVIENLQLTATGATGKALKIWNVNNIILNNVIVAGTQGNGIDMAGTAHFYFYNTNMYAAGGSPFFSSNSAVGAQNIGPGAIVSSTVSITASSFPAIAITGDPLGVAFIDLDIAWASSTGTTAVDLNGGSGTPVGSLQFIQSHAESTFNTTNTGKTFRVGNTVAFGTLIVQGGNFWGLGDGTNYQQDWMQVVAARNVIVDGALVSKLASTNGFSRAMVRMETTFTGNYSFRNMIADISGSMYSDANGKCSGTNTCSLGGQIFDTIALGTPLAATSGGTGFASYAVGDLLYANTTTTLAKLADIATTNALISGGVGVAPSWGKIGNSTLTNSSTTVNGQTCTLGSTCTVTAAATGVTVGTTTVGSGTSHGVLTNNAAVLGNTAAGTSGQLFLGVTGAEPNWGTMSGDATITNAGVLTLASTISAGGPTGSATVAPIITYDAKGRLTAVSTATITPAVGSITGLGTGVATALGNTLNAASGLVGFSGALGTPTSGVGTNLTGTATGFTAGNATNGATVSTTTNASFFPLFAASSSNSNQPFNLDSSFTYNPSTKTLTAVNFSGFATSASVATSATTTAITDDVATNATMFPTWVTAATGNLAQKTSSTLFAWNPGTAQLKIGAGADTPIASGTSIYLTNAGTTSMSIRDSTNDVEVTMLAASFGAIVGTATNSSLLLRTNNANQMTISGAGVFTFNTIPAADTATVDNTLCVSGAGVILKGSGTLGICLGTSSARYKHDIISMGAGLAEIARLSPKNFFYKKGFGDDGARLQYGFIAEDVVKVLPGVTAPDKYGKPNSVDMVAMIPVLVNAIKQLKSDNDNLRMDVQALQAKQPARRAAKQ